MSFVWKFEPESGPAYVERPRRKWVSRKERKANTWVAPEHARDASAMKRDFDRNDKGEPISKVKHLVVDKRPTIMVPPRPTRLGWK